MSTVLFKDVRPGLGCTMSASMKWARNVWLSLNVDYHTSQWLAMSTA
jgi:hypothetical protein